MIGLAAVAGIQARVSAQLARAYDASRMRRPTRGRPRGRPRRPLRNRSATSTSPPLAWPSVSGPATISPAASNSSPSARPVCAVGSGTTSTRFVGRVKGDGRPRWGGIRLSVQPRWAGPCDAGSDGVVCVWDVSQRRIKFRLTEHKATVTSLAFSRDGRRLASGSLDGTVRLWDATDGRKLRELSENIGEVFSLAFHPLRAELAIGTGKSRQPTEPGEIRIWNVEKGPSLASLSGHHGAVNCVVYSPDGQLLRVRQRRSNDRSTRDADGQPQHTLKLAPARRIAPTANRVLQFRDVKTGRDWRLVQHVRSARRIGFSGDGTRLTAAVADGTVAMWEVPSGKEGLSLAAHEGVVHAIAISPSGKVVASAGMDRVVKLWSVATGSELSSYLGHRNEVNELAYSPDGQWLASGDDDGSIKLWRPDQRQETYLFTHLSAAVFGVAFSPDGKTLAAGTADLFQPRKAGEIKLWDVASRRKYGR